MNINRKQIIFIFITFCLAITFIEVLLAFSTIISPKIEQLLSQPGFSSIVLNIVPDDRLGHRPNPEFPGHDSKGFRNPAVPNKTEIVALGDSQTYGVGVKSQDTWPRQLEYLTGSKIYNMSYGGYGPTHSLILWEEAIDLNPSLIIEAFYSGNDLFDSFNLVYNKGQLSELKSSDSNIQAAVKNAEESESIKKHVSKMFRMGRKKTTPQKVFSIRAFLSSNSKLYGLLRRIRYELRFLTPDPKPEEHWEKAKAFAKANKAYCQNFEDGQFRTIFTSEYRFSALDLQDSRIAEGHRISLSAIKRMNELANLQDKRFIVMLIPTKELVFKPLVQKPSSSYKALIQSEEEFWKITKKFLKKNRVEYLDVLPTLREQLYRGIQPYQVSHDGHPNEHGHLAIAKLVYARIKRK